MQDTISDLSKKYRDEMLRLYGKRSAMAEEEPPAAGFSTSEQGNVENAPAAPEEDSVQENISGAPAASDMPETFQPPWTEEEGMLRLPGNMREENADRQDADFGLESSLPDVTGEPGNYDEPVLPDYIRPQPPSLPGGWEEEMAEEARNTASGKLQVAAATGNRAFPVEGASVRIFAVYGDTRRLLWLLTTDSSGETPVVEMPAPPSSLSQSPDNVRPYAVYRIEIAADGFFRSIAEEVPIFAGVTSKQTFELIPLPSGMPEDAETLRFSESV